MTPQLKRAIKVAKSAHKGQKRKSGEAFIKHPQAVLEKLRPLKLKEETLLTAILHDVIEDSDYSAEDLKQNFGEYISKCVEYLSKENNENKSIKQKNYLNKLKQGIQYSETVYLVKLADVMHNTETLKFFNLDKQHKQAQEVYDYYLPLFYKNLPSVSAIYHDFCLHCLYTILEQCTQIIQKHNTLNYCYDL